MLKAAFLFLALFLAACSKNEDPLKVCTKKDFHYSTHLLFLNGATRSNPKIYLFKNETQHTLILNHPVKHPAASAGWSQSIEPGQYAAFLSADPQFAWSCALSSSSSAYEPIPCAKALFACQITSYSWKDAPENGASFWLASAKSLKDVFRDLVARGISSSS